MDRNKYFQKGKRASRLSTEDKNKLLENIRESLACTARKKISQLKLEGSLLEQEIGDKQTELQARGELSESDHKKSFFRGLVLGVAALLGLFGETYLVLWTIKYFSVGKEGFIIALTIVAAGTLAIEKYLIHIRKLYPDKYDRYLAHTSFIAFLLFLISLYLIADVRGSILQTQAILNDASLEETVKRVDDIYRSTGHSIAWLTGLGAVMLALACGICAHESLERLIVSGFTIKIYRKIRYMRKRQKNIASQICEYEHWPQEAVKEYEAGMISGLENKAKKINLERYLVSPLAAILLAILILILIKGVAKGAEHVYDEHVIVLFDLSKSISATDYAGTEEFQKNLILVPEIIKQMNPGTYLEVIGITEGSFSRPFVIVEGMIPREQGMFKEKEARAKLALINAWNKHTLQANAIGTDIFGALYMVSQMFRGENGVLKKLIIISDMRDCARDFNMEGAQSIDLVLLSKVREAGLMPPLNEVKVWVLGAHSVGKTEIYWDSLKEFWCQYFSSVGAKLISYDLNRRMRNE